MPLNHCEMVNSEYQHPVSWAMRSPESPMVFCQWFHEVMLWPFFLPLTFCCCWSYSCITNSSTIEDSLAECQTRTSLLAYHFHGMIIFLRLKMSGRYFLQLMKAACDFPLGTNTFSACFSMTVNYHKCRVLFSVHRRKKGMELMGRGAIRYKPSSSLSANFSLTLCIFSALGVNKVS